MGPGGPACSESGRPRAARCPPAVDTHPVYGRTSTPSRPVLELSRLAGGLMSRKQAPVLQPNPLLDPTDVITKARPVPSTPGRGPSGARGSGLSRFSCIPNPSHFHETAPSSARASWAVEKLVSTPGFGTWARNPYFLRAPTACTRPTAPLPRPSFETFRRARASLGSPEPRIHSTVSSIAPCSRLPGPGEPGSYRARPAMDWLARFVHRLRRRARQNREGLRGWSTPSIQLPHPEPITVQRLRAVALSRPLRCLRLFGQRCSVRSGLRCVLPCRVAGDLLTS